MNSELAPQDSYGSVIRSSEWLKTTPFEHTSRNVPHNYFIQRLIQERWLFEGDSLCFPVLLTIAIHYDGREQELLRTFESCILQSALRFNILVVAGDRERLHSACNGIDQRLQQTPFLAVNFKGRIFFSESVDGAKDGTFLGDFLVCIKSGDVFHPSFVTSFYLEVRDSRYPAAVYLWNEMVVAFDPKPKVLRFIRKPDLERYTLFHLNYISYNFAFQTSLLRGFPNFDFVFRKNDGHLFLLFALKSEENRFTTIPQYLFVRDSIHVHQNRDLVEPFLKNYREYFQAFDLTLELIDDPSFYRLVPDKKPDTVSVIIPFRDKPELTCRAVLSVLDQRMDAFVEIILVNNQSRWDSIEHIARFVETHQVEKKIIRFVNYDRPFNHSAECNLGAGEARGDCLVFFNNDAELKSPDALVQMAAWSLLPGIGTVGLHIINGEGATVSAGIAPCLTSSKEFAAIMAECEEEDFSFYNRETWGNSFACAATSRETFDSVGLLDEVNFPVGYNDVDYNMRCRRAGLSNIFLGSLSAVHVPAVSRGASDELYQKILLQRRFPEILSASLYQLEIEKRPLRNDRQKISFKGKLKKLLGKTFQKLAAC